MVVSTNTTPARWCSNQHQCSSEELIQMLAWNVCDGGWTGLYSLLHKCWLINTKTQWHGKWGVIIQTCKQINVLCDRSMISACGATVQRCIMGRMKSADGCDSNTDQNKQRFIRWRLPVAQSNQVRASWKCSVQTTSLNHTTAENTWPPLYFFFARRLSDLHVWEQEAELMLGHQFTVLTEFWLTENKVL